MPRRRPFVQPAASPAAASAAPSVASSAARSAACSAVRSTASSAARSAARSPAWSAAWSAAMGLTLLAALACAPGEGPDGDISVAVRDSAGITVVENPGPSATIGAAPLGEATTFDVGILEGDAAYQLFDVTDAARLPDGGVAVLEAGAHRIRFYGPDGIWRLDVGGEGDGPGEFRDPRTLVRWPGDSLGVWDRRTRRLTLLSASGDLGRDLPLSGVAGMNAPTLHATLPGPRLLLSAIDFGFGPDGPTAGARRPDVRLAAADLSGDTVTEFGTHPGEHTLIRASPESVEILRNPYQPSWAVAALDEAVVVADTRRPELRWYDARGRLMRIVRMPGLRRPFSPEAQAAEIDARVAAAPTEAHAGLRRAYELLPMPDTLPALTDLVPDHAGGLWVRRFHLAASDDAVEWWVVDGTGVVTGRRHTPPDFDVFEIGEDWVLGRLTDPRGVERVQLRPLPPGG